MKFDFAILSLAVVVTSIGCGGCSLKNEPGKSGGPLKGTKAGQVRDDNQLQLKLVWIPPGSFTMGSPADEKERNSNEDQVEVTLTRGFWLGQYELKQSEWYAVMGSRPWRRALFTPEESAGDENPAIDIDWNQAREFCRKLTESEREAGRLPADWEYTLPTEAQWEYACRAGTTTRYSFGDDESKLEEYAWSSENTMLRDEAYVHPVGHKKPNPWGLYDMHGNVMEFCLDEYHAKLPGGTDPMLPIMSDDPEVVFRSGDWSALSFVCRSAFRSRNRPTRASAEIGFRVALVPTEK